MSKPDLVALAEQLRKADVERFPWLSFCHKVADDLESLASQPSLYEAGLRDMRERCEQLARSPRFAKVDRISVTKGPNWTEETGMAALVSSHARCIADAIAALPADGGEKDRPSLSELHRRAVKAVEAFADAASYEETMWTGWGDCVVPPYAEMRRVKAQQAVSALRDAQKSGAES